MVMIFTPANKENKSPAAVDAGSSPAPGRLEKIVDSGIMASVYLYILALPFNLILIQAGVAFAFFFVLIRHFVVRKVTIRPSPLDLPFFIYIGCLLISLLFSAFKEVITLQSASSFWVIIGFYIIYWGLKDLRMLKNMTIGLFIGGILISLCAILQHFWGIDFLHPQGTQLYQHITTKGIDASKYVALGRYDRHTAFAFAFLFLTCLAFAFVIVLKRIRLSHKVFFTISLAFFIAAITLTYVRAVWFGIFLSLFIFIFFIKKRTFIYLITGVIILFSSLLLLSPSIKLKLMSTFYLNYQANKDRIFIWDRTLQMYKDHPFTGIGYGNYQKVCPRYFDPVNPQFPYRTRPHNLYLTFLVETGPLGLIAFMLIWAVFFYRAFQLVRSPRRNNFEDPFIRSFSIGGISAVLAFLIGSITQDAFFNGDVAFVLWFVVGAIMWLHQVYAHGPETTPPGKDLL